MSLYARLACVDSKVLCFVGKVLRHPDGRINYFHIGGPWEPLNWQRTELNQVIWKMLADHADHHLKVLVTGDTELDQVEFFWIGDVTGPHEISSEDYLKNWEGVNNPQEREVEKAVPASLACLDCKVLGSLGNAVARPDGQINCFHVGSASEPLNWQRTELNQMIWKMLADHAGHHLKVLVSGDEELDQFHFFRIGDITSSDGISIEDYLKDWDGITTTVYKDQETWAKEQLRKNKEKWS